MKYDDLFLNVLNNSANLEKDYGKIDEESMQFYREIGWLDFAEAREKEPIIANIGLVRRSNRVGKKFMVTLRNGNVVHFGASGYKIGAHNNAERADNYCKRHGHDNVDHRGNITPEGFSRMTWACYAEPKKGYDSEAPQLKLGDNIYSDKFTKYYTFINQ